MTLKRILFSLGLLLLPACAHMPVEQRGHSETTENAYADHMIDVGGFKMKTRTFGLTERDPGEPLVIFENGSLAPLGSWSSIPQQVSAFAPVLLYDRATIGGSEWDGKVGTPEHVADRLWSLLKELNAPPPYILVGWSWGETS